VIGEPQLGRRGLYAGSDEERMARLWVLNQSDGGASLLDIAERANMPFDLIATAADSLQRHELLEELRRPR